MIDEEMRRMVFRLKEKGRGTRSIAGGLGISRTTVKRILEQGTPVKPAIVRESKLEEYDELIRQLYVKCEGSLTRVAEDLEKHLETAISYSTLTKYCRDKGFGAPQKETEPSGRYVTGPGVEMQHDTSPIPLLVGKIERLYQAASLKFGFSRVRYLRFYRRFTRFHCKDFLTRGLRFFKGSCSRCIIDNTTVIIAYGTGSEAVVAPEMEAFEKRFKFRFVAHEVGDANRSAKVERDFDFIQRNFTKGRDFVDDDDLNAQAEDWCRKKNAAHNRRLKDHPSHLFIQEQPHLIKLPEYIPPVYLIHQRRVDVEGFVTLDGNLYSAPNNTIGKNLVLRETMDTVTLLDGRQELCVHPRIPEGERSWSRLEGHGRKQRRRTSRPNPSPQEKWLAARSDGVRTYMAGLKKLGRRRYLNQVRKLYGTCHDYDFNEVEAAIKRALQYNLFDTKRLESMLLQKLGASLFGFPTAQNDDDPGCVSPVVEPEQNLTEAEQESDLNKDDNDGQDGESDDA